MARHVWRHVVYRVEEYGLPRGEALRGSCSLAGLKRLPVEEEIGSSNLLSYPI